MTYEQCMKAILANPEDDAPRHELAKILRSSDPKWAKFIEADLEWSKQKREHRDSIGGYRPTTLLEHNKYRWARDLDMYMGEAIVHRNLEFHRGLPWLCSMNPYVFMEHGEYILSCIAPLRGIEFFLPEEDRPFPARELAACPLLGRLEEIRFSMGSGYSSTLMPGEMDILAASPHLTRVLAIDVRGANPTLETFEALAANPLTRKCLMIREVAPPHTGEAGDGGPIGEFWENDDWGSSYLFEMSAEGHELERKYGYLPWLHDENVVDPPDAHYYVEQKLLPMFVPGSPADAPTPLGSGGLFPRRKIHPRSQARFTG